MPPFDSPMRLDRRSTEQDENSYRKRRSASPSHSPPPSPVACRKVIEPRRNRSGSRPSDYLKKSASTPASSRHDKKSRHFNVPLPVEKHGASFSKSVNRKRHRVESDEGEEAALITYNNTASSCPCTDHEGHQTFLIDKPPMNHDVGVLVGSKDHHCPPPAPLGDVREHKGEEQTDCHLHNEHQDHLQSSVSPRGVENAEHALPTTTTSSPPLPSPPPSPPRDSSGDKDNADTWDTPCRCNPDALRTLTIEYWDRTQACKEKKWDHMDYIDATYVSREKWIRTSVLGEQEIVLEPNMFPYNTPYGIEHWTLWSRRDLSLTEVEAYVMDWIKTERPEVKRWNLDENAQRSIDIYHVHIYLQSVPDSEVRPPIEDDYYDRRRRYDDDDEGKDGRKEGEREIVSSVVMSTHEAGHEGDDKKAAPDDHLQHGQEQKEEEKGGEGEPDTKRQRG